MAMPVMRETGRCPDALVVALRAEVQRGLDWARTSSNVAAVLRADLPLPSGLLPPDLMEGDPSGYQSHLVHAEPDGSFSISVMVWLPGQQTPIHDHVSWCVPAVLQGAEHEEVFTVVGSGLRLVERHVNQTGMVCSFTPPGDIHRVRNCCDQVAISMHVYGADISRLGNSIRREYTLPILA
jgi:3-mercaptopropionate dioxygenase